MQKVSKVSMIILMQPDIAQAVTFYQNLGLKLMFHLKEKWAELDMNGVKIGLCPTSTPAHEKRVGVVFEVPNLHAFYEEHKETNMFIGSPQEALHGIMISVKDPGNNVFDLYQPTPEKLATFVRRVAGQPCCKDQTDGCCKATRVNRSAEDLCA